MKKLIFIVFCFQISSFAQVADSVNFASTDSINIRAMVEEQILNAMLKQSQPQVSTANEKDVISVPVNEATHKVENGKTNNAEINIFTRLFYRIPLQYKVYIFLSTAIIFGLIFRRSLLHFKKASIKKLKNRIALLREEKIGGSVVNPKKRKLRLELKENLSIIKPSEIEIAKTAKQLNISKGELILAARLKLLEVNKIQGTI